MLNPKDRNDLCTSIHSLARSLVLSTQFAQTCREKGTHKQLEFIHGLLKAEVDMREQNRINRLLKKAAFPFFKTFENYEEGQVKLPDDLSLTKLQNCDFIAEKLNLVCYGPVGTGKTHLAVAAGVAACQRGLNVRFFTVASLVRLLSSAAGSEKLDKLLAELRKADLLILDEWGYVPLDLEGARLLFQVISDSYETRSIIITTNLEFSRWGSVMADEQMAAAVIDRLVHHGHLLIFEGPSYRMEHALMRGSDAVPQ